MTIPRVCHVCGAEGPEEGPLPYTWSVHPVPAPPSAHRKRKERRQMFLLCSDMCRKRSSLSIRT